jgi:hypothetical protein
VLLFFSVLVTLWVLQMGLLIWFVQVLRIDHPSEYARLGDPWVLPFDPLSLGRLVKLTLTRDCDRLGDKTLIRLSRLLRVVTTLGCIWVLMPFIILMIDRG